MTPSIAPSDESASAAAAPYFLQREGETAVATIDSTVYPDEVVFKALYWYGGEYEVAVRRDADHLSVTMTLKEGEMSDARFGALRARLLQDLVDFRTRAVVERETRVVRELLVAKAFASADEFDHPPPGSPEDPVGFTLEEWEG